MSGAARSLRGIFGSLVETARSAAAQHPRSAEAARQPTRNSRNRGEATLLATFCNVRDRSKPVVAAIDLHYGGEEIRWIELKGGAFVRGATGLCLWNDLVCVAHQGAPGTPQGFVLLDPGSDFEQVYEGTLPRPAGVHSVCSRKGDLYLVTSRRDSVYRATLDRRSGRWDCSLYWTFPGSSGEEDVNHLNAIECVDGDLYVSGFGEKVSKQWPSATRGFVLNIDRNQYVMEEIYHPHSLLEDSSKLWTCSSARNSLLSNNGDEYAFPPGYIRGLAIAEEVFYVGSSKRRRVSESTGVVNRRKPDEFKGTCCVYRLDKGAEQATVLVDFSEIRNEIYEMMLL
jgi:hypothetical protein